MRPGHRLEAAGPSLNTASTPGRTLLDLGWTLAGAGGEAGTDPDPDIGVIRDTNVMTRPVRKESSRQGTIG